MFLMITDGGVGQAERQALQIEPAPKPGPSDWILGRIFAALGLLGQLFGYDPEEEEDEAQTRDGI